MSILAPSVAYTSVADWPTVEEYLNQFVSEIANYWAILETPFELKLSHNELKVPETTNGVRIGRGRVFWEEAELSFRFDGSLASRPYRLVWLADAGKTPSVSGFQSATDLPKGYWKQVNFRRALWGEYLNQAIGASWFVSRIPQRLNYPGLTPQQHQVPLIKGTEYRHLGRMMFYRFTSLDCEKLN